MHRALLAFLLLCAPALAHDAPSGWSYPKNCCDKTHCRPIACSEIEELYANDPTNRRFVYARAHVRFWFTQPSGDDLCHACFDHPGTPEKPAYGRCLFVPNKIM